MDPLLPTRRTPVYSVVCSAGEMEMSSVFRVLHAHSAKVKPISSQQHHHPIQHLHACSYL
jgi:hypothetical protein